MHKPHHIYSAGILAGALCGINSAFLTYAGMSYVWESLQVKGGIFGNPIINLALVSVLVGAGIGLIVSFAVHQMSK